MFHNNECDHELMFKKSMMYTSVIKKLTGSEIVGKLHQDTRFQEDTYSSFTSCPAASCHVTLLFVIFSSNSSVLFLTYPMQEHTALTSYSRSSNSPRVFLRCFLTEWLSLDSLSFVAPVITNSMTQRGQEAINTSVQLQKSNLSKQCQATSLYLSGNYISI